MTCEQGYCGGGGSTRTVLNYVPHGLERIIVRTGRFLVLISVLLAWFVGFIGYGIVSRLGSGRHG
jgi:hypothetical protein